MTIQRIPLDFPWGTDGKDFQCIADGYVPLCQQILNITVAEVESVTEPYGITNDIRWKSVPLVSLRPEIILYRELTCQYRRNS